MLTLDLGNTSTMHAPPILKRLAGVANPHMVEVGVLRGKLSHRLLQSRTDLHLWMVDAWQELPVGSPGRDFAERHGDPCGVIDQAQHDDNRACAEEVQKCYGLRAHLLPYESSAAETKLMDGYQLDLVFLDGGHWYEQVMADLYAWWPRVKPGGWIGGHDYGSLSQGVDVVRAVDAWSDSLSLPAETDAFFTWFVRKPLEVAHGT